MYIFKLFPDDMEKNDGDIRIWGVLIIDRALLRKEFLNSWK